MNESMLPQSVRAAGEGDQRDQVAEKLKQTAQNVMVIVFGLLPIFFIPLSSAPLEYSKTLFVIAGLFVALILYCLSILRSGEISLPRSLSLILLWAVVVTAVISTLLSGDTRDSFFGDSFGIHTTGFLMLLALSASVWTLIGTKKVAVMRLYMLLAISTLLLGTYHVMRLFFGPDFLSFGIFTGTVSSPIGSWNDLALFLGLTVLLSLITLEQLTLTRAGRLVFAGVVAVALLMLAVINFGYVWIVLGLVSLVMLVYTLGRNRFMFGQSLLTPTRSETDITTLLITIGVFVVSVLFFLSGSSIGAFISEKANISYIEVRPSLEATTGIMRGVYTDNALLGIGPNKFIDAWRVHKNEALNTTVFWNTNFLGGSGYIPTFFVTTGLLGALAWIVFLGYFTYSGVRLLVRSSEADRVWYYIASSAFVGAAYIWLMSFVYIPGAVVLLIGALCTGITIVASQMIGNVRPLSLKVGSDRRAAFAMTLVIIAVIVGSVGSLYGTGRMYASAYIFSDSVRSIQAGASLDDVVFDMTRAYELYPSDVYARRIAEYQIVRMNTLLGTANPGTEEQEQFQDAISRGIDAGRLATEVDQTEPENWAVLGRIYTILAGAQIEGAYDRAREALLRARDLDPKNPARYLALAELEAQVGNFEGARDLINEALSYKSNYVEALTLLTQIEITAGNADGAVLSTRSVISLEPRNPARHYQLGILESSRGNIVEAIQSFEQAVRLDQDFSNARYYLALAYESTGRFADAKEQLEYVLRLNPGNQDVISLIQQIDANERLQTTPQLPEGDSGGDVGNSLPDDQSDVVSDGTVDTPLLTPVNTPPQTASTEDDASAVSAESSDESVETNEDSEGNGTE